MNRTELMLKQGQAPVRAIKVLEVIEPTGPEEPVQVCFLLQAYRRRLRALVDVAPPWLAEEVTSASQAVGKDRAAVWLSEN